MKFTISSVNRFLFFKLPSAYWSGVRLQKLNDFEAETFVRYKWFNQNPFRSMYFAVQAMAAELSTGALVMKKISESKEQISMLVAQNNAVFHKKAVGKIVFKCTDGSVVDEAIDLVLNPNEGTTFWMKTIGTDEKGDIVSVFNFEWTIKKKKNK